MNLYQIVCAPDNLDADGIALLQATPITVTLNGAKAAAGVATMAAAQKVTVLSGGNDLAKTALITGTDADGGAQTETLTLTNGSTATSTNYFKTVTSIVISEAAAGNITAGFTAVAISPTFKLYKQPLPARVAVGISVTGTINYDLQDCFTAAPHTTWIQNATVNGKTAGIEYPYVDTPCMASRLLVNSATSGSVTGNFCIMRG